MVNVISALVGGTVAITIIYLIRRDRLIVRHGLAWLMMAIVFFTVGLVPEAIDEIGGWVGVSYPPTLAIALGIGALTIKALISDIELSRTEIHYTMLVQNYAILESRLRFVEEALASTTPAPSSRPDKFDRLGPRG